MRICEHAHATEKVFCTNLSAPFICEFFGDRLMNAMPYVDYLFGNETVSINEYQSIRTDLFVVGSESFW